MRAWIMVGILLCLLATLESARAEVQLAGDTSHRQTSTYVAGETVQLTFAATGVSATDALTLRLTVQDEHDTVIETREFPVTPGADGAWKVTLEAPHHKLGFYRVWARLSNGVTLPRLGSRRAGFLTYSIAVDPAKRVRYPQRESFFGMQGDVDVSGTLDMDMDRYLGIRQRIGGYNWAQAEPDHAGQFATRRAQMWEPTVAQTPVADAWSHYPMPSLFMAPDWAIQAGSRRNGNGILTPAGEEGWQHYCTAVATDYAHGWGANLDERVYQITWEPVAPWGFAGANRDIIHIYEIAYPAIHAADPKAVVVGPTGSGITQTDVNWNIALLKDGLGNYLDGLSIHPYHPYPPETTGLVEHVRALQAAIRQYTGKKLPIYGTEVGHATKEDPALDLEQARAFVRENLILQGEGFRMNDDFFMADYYSTSEPGYGLFYNLNPRKSYLSDTIAPKPVVPALAAQSLLLEGHRPLKPVDGLGKTAMGYAFARAGSVVLALWDYGDTPSTVTVPVGVKSVTVYDWMGNASRRKTTHGKLTVTLGPDPIYITGVALRSPVLFMTRAMGVGSPLPRAGHE